ncbi:MAG: small subunit ribosomal protein S17 [Planctomycetota bacterium]|jgi:small subunit ribosomal protein S17
MEAENNTTERGRRRVLQGVVVTDTMNKSISIRVERLVKHPRYKKYVRTHSKYVAHDEDEVAKIGDTVEIIECRPMSKTKRWRINSVIAKALVDGGAL